MIREIVTFMETVKTDSFKDLLPDGLHILIKLNSEDSIEVKNFEYYNKKLEKTEFISKCSMLYKFTDCVSPNKRLDGAHKRINLSCSPFCVGFRKEHLEKKLNKEDIQAYFTRMLNSSQQFCSTVEQKNCNKVFYEFCGVNLLSFLNEIFQEMVNTKDIEIKKNEIIYLYLENMDIDEYRKTYENYLSKRVFNKEEYNIDACDKKYGISDELSTFSPKKPFLRHQTALFDLNLRVSDKDAISLYTFFKYRRQLPNPLPIFIDKKELNKTMVTIFTADEDRKIGYSEIIKDLYELREGDLGNYYLLYFVINELVDFDFVSSFEYHIPELKIENIFLKKETEFKINNIFTFERTIVREIFDNQLVVKTKDGRLILKYFSDIDPKYMSAKMYQLILKYRKPFYNYIYKSRRNELNSRIFHEILCTGIVDDLKSDAFRDGKHSHDYRIRLKLNIWFSLYEYFENNKNKKGKTMATKIKDLQERNALIAGQQEEHLESDDEFAFMSGQIIYYLLSQSEASNKSHALLEPFLQKTDCEQFKSAIARTFEQYKHAIHFKKSKFEKMASEVLSYSTGKNIKALMPLILAGYFSDNVIYKKSV